MASGLGQGEIDGAAVRLAPVLALRPPLRLATFAGKLGCAAALLARPGYQGSAAAGNPARPDKRLPRYAGGGHAVLPGHAGAGW
jgi:hypothetical protein